MFSRAEDSVSLLGADAANSVGLSTGNLMNSLKGSSSDMNSNWKSQGSASMEEASQVEAVFTSVSFLFVTCFLCFQDVHHFCGVVQTAYQ